MPPSLLIEKEPLSQHNCCGISPKSHLMLLIDFLLYLIDVYRKKKKLIVG